MTPPKNRPGRPLKFTSVEELELQIERYFADRDREEDTRIFAHEQAETEEYEDFDEKGMLVLRRRRICTKCHRNPFNTVGCVLVSGELKKKQPYTVSSLADKLDCDRKTLNNYEVKEEFFPTIQRAKQRIEAYAADALFDKNVPTKGVIFSLTNNGDDWAEKTEQAITLPKDGAAELAAGLLGGNQPVAGVSGTPGGTAEVGAGGGTTES